MKWPLEASGLCCAGVKVKVFLNEIADPPEPLNINSTHDYSKVILDNIHLYNFFFQMM